VTKHYELYAIIVHLGPGIQFGHYTCVIKHKERWFLFDDENITLVDERFLSTIFGNSNSSTVAYMLFYQMISEEKRPQPQAQSQPQPQPQPRSQPEKDSPTN